MESNQRLEFVITTLIRFRKLWLIPAVAGVLLALIYVLAFRAETWSARQTLIVRDDMLGQPYKPGQFNSLESMKSAQETILEIARKPQVIRNVLGELGPPNPGLFTVGSYPDDETIEDTQGKISFSAPNGAEFGKTEVVILNVKASTPERSRKFIQLLLDQVDQKIGEVREQRLLSMESELTQARDGAALSLERSAKKLREMEDKLGADVGAMNGLNGSQPGDGSARLELTQIRLEKRAAQSELDEVLAAQEMLLSARLRPEEMLASSSEFLRTQPKLEALQKSLVEAQQAYANNVGRYQSGHPLVHSSEETILAMQQQIYLELEGLTRSVDSRITELRTRIRRLDELADAENDRLVRLGSKRVDHLTINSEVREKTEILNRAQSRLGEIEAMRMAAGHVQWLSRMGEPQISTRPDGVGKKATVMAGGICGLMLGLGLVMLVAPPMELPSKGRPGRRTDLPRRNGNEEVRLEAPSLNDIVGPTAASAIQSASAATAATVSKGVSIAKSAFNKPDAPKSEPINIPHVTLADLEPPITQEPPQQKPVDKPVTPEQSRPVKIRPADSSVKDAIQAIRKPVQVAPTESIETTKQTPGAKVKTLPKKELAPPAKELTPPAKELAPPAKELTPLAKELAPLAKELAPLAKELAPPTKTAIPPAKEVTQPTANDLSRRVSAIDDNPANSAPDKAKELTPAPDADSVRAVDDEPVVAASVRAVDDEPVVATSVSSATGVDAADSSTSSLEMTTVPQETGVVPSEKVGDTPVTDIVSAAKPLDLAKTVTPKIPVDRSVETEESAQEPLDVTKFVTTAKTEPVPSTSKTPSQDDGELVAEPTSRGPQKSLSAEEILAELRGKSEAKKRVAESTVPLPDLAKENNEHAEMMRRAANLRPVDLLRSADDDQPTSTAKTSGASSTASAQPKENPFLKHLPGSKVSAEPKVTQQQPSPQQPAPQQSTPQQSTPIATDGTPTLPIPEQIKGLADSIANFAAPREP